MVKKIEILKNLRVFEISGRKSVEFIYLATWLFERRQNFAKFILSGLAIRRSDEGGLTYDRKHYPSKTPEQIFEMFFVRRQKKYY